MLQVNNTYIDNLAEIAELEETNHKDSFEYLPEAKSRTYADILGTRNGGNFLSIKLSTSEVDNDTECKDMITAGQYFRVLAALARMGESFTINDTEYKVLSMSYKESLDENFSKEALIVNALVCSDNGEISKKNLVEFTKNLANGLHLSKYYPDKEQDDELGTGIIEDIDADRESVMKAFSKTEDQTDKHESDEPCANNEENNESCEISASVDDEDDADAFNREENTSDSEHGSSLTLKSYQEMYEEASADENNQYDYESSFYKKEKELEETVDDSGEINEQKNDVKTQETESTTLENVVEQSDSSVSDGIVNENLDLNAKDDAKSNSGNKDIPFLNRIDNYTPSVDLTNKELFYELHDVDAAERTTASRGKLDKCFSAVMRYFSTTIGNEKAMTRQALQGEMSKDYFMKNVENFAKSKNAKFNIPVEDMPLFLKRIERALFSYYVLEPALNDPDITDIKITSAKNFNVKVKGKHYTVKGIGFLDNDDYITFLFNLLLRNNIQMKYPIIVFTDTEFCKDYRLRFDITLGDINTSQLPTIHIRKVPKDKLTVDDLVRVGMMPEKVATYLREQVKTAKGIVFAGPSASGKTNAMNAFVDEIPFEDSVLCIQESDELFSNKHPNFMCQHILKDALGRIIIGLNELGQNGLLCDIKYFLIGEIKGAEAREFLRACNTGHRCMCTIHTPSSIETIPRFADYIKYGSDYSLEEAERMLKDLEIIVYIENFKVKEITRIKGYDDKEKKMIYEPIYRADLEN